MELLKKENGILLKSDIDLLKTFECGQCFRFNKCGDYFEGVAFGKYLRIVQAEDGILFLNSEKEDIEKIWYRFFDMDCDYDAVSREIDKDKLMHECISKGKGIRILNAEIFETLISFIISQNNNIPRIKKIVESLCENFGDKIEYEGTAYYTFPDVKKLASLKSEDLSVIRSGFRAKYILDAVSKIYSGEIDLEKIPEMSFEDAKSELMKIKGVGEKVASCTLLFSCGFKQAFPMDVWMKKVMERYYEGQSGEIFGEYAGVAQQYLFYYARENKI